MKTGGALSKPAESLRSPRAISFILVGILSWPLAVVVMLFGGIALDRSIGVSHVGLFIVLVGGLGGTWLVVLYALSALPRYIQLHREGDEILFGSQRLPVGRGELWVTGAEFHRLPIIRYRIGFQWPGSTREQVLLRNCLDAPVTRQFATTVARLGGWTLRWRLPLDFDGETLSPQELMQSLPQRLAQNRAGFQELRDIIAREPQHAERLRAAGAGGGGIELNPRPLNTAWLWPLALLALMLLGAGSSVYSHVAEQGPPWFETAAVGLAALGVLFAVYVVLVAALAVLHDEVYASPDGLRLRRCLLGVPIREQHLPVEAIHSIHEYRHGLYHRLIVYTRGGRSSIFVGVLARWRALRCARLVIEAALVGEPVPEGMLRRTGAIPKR